MAITKVHFFVAELLRACSAECRGSDGGNIGREAPPRAERRNPASGGPGRGFAKGHLLAGLSWDGGSDMTAVRHPTDFICPGCGADYKVVHVKAETDPPHRLIHCKVCKRSLAPTDREYILKYFLINRKQAKKQRI